MIASPVPPLRERRQWRQVVRFLEDFFRQRRPRRASTSGIPPASTILDEVSSVIGVAVLPVAPACRRPAPARAALRSVGTIGLDRLRSLEPALMVGDARVYAAILLDDAGALGVGVAKASLRIAARPASSTDEPVDVFSNRRVIGIGPRAAAGDQSLVTGCARVRSDAHDRVRECGAAEKCELAERAAAEQIAASARRTARPDPRVARCTSTEMTLHGRDAIEVCKSRVAAIAGARDHDDVERSLGGEERRFARSALTDRCHRR